MTAGDQPLDQLIRRAERGPHPQPALDQAGQRRDHLRGGQVGRPTELERLIAGVGRQHPVDHLFEGVQMQPQLACQLVGHAGRRHAAGASDEQLLPEFLLQGPDLDRDGRL
jgi:hypothetical protein